MMTDSETTVDRWAESLRAVCLEYIGAGESLEWGKRDCCQFAARYVKGVTGLDHASQFHYDSKRSAQRILASHGGIEALVSRFLGAPHNGDAAPGDLVMCALAVEGAPAMATLGVANGHYVLAIHPDRGLVRLPISSIQCAWSV
jgi:hypothetical protein